MIKQVKCYPNTSCDYFFFKNSDGELTLTRDSSTVTYGDTFDKIGITFNADSSNPLVAGNPESVALATKSLIIKRQKLGESFLQEIAEFPYIIDSGVELRYNSFIDYSAVSGEQYIYYFIVKEKTADQTYQLGMPISTDITPTLDWDHWVLLLGDNYINQDGKEDKSKVIINKLFLFELNVASGAMNLGTKYSQQENFTPYPKIQKSYAHNWSGTLKGLLGMIAPNDVDFVQTPNMLQEFKDLAINNQRKFLKDRDGNLWEVELTAAPNITNTDNLTFDLKEKQISWTEVADASNIGLYAYDPNIEWVLTETGYPNPLNTYQIKSDKIIGANEYLTDNKEVR